MTEQTHLRTRLPRATAGHLADFAADTTLDMWDRVYAAWALSRLEGHPSPPPPTGEELPGEAAALAAFRKVRAERADASAEALAALGHGAVPRSCDAGLVRIGARGEGARRPRRSRALRLGLAAALTVGMVGGVAAAAGTGVLPTPFDGTEPEPAATVSAAVSPGRPSAPPSPLEGVRGGAVPGTTPAAPDGGTARDGGDAGDRDADDRDALGRGGGDHGGDPAGPTHEGELRGAAGDGHGQGDKKNNSNNSNKSNKNKNKNNKNNKGDQGDKGKAGKGNGGKEGDQGGDGGEGGDGDDADIAPPARDCHHPHHPDGPHRPQRSHGPSAHEPRPQRQPAYTPHAPSSARTS
ncbi:hypothetical protein STENM327S_08735 [Streptomyces tendae]